MMPFFGSLIVALSPAPVATATPTATDLNLSVESGGANIVQVAPGASVPFAVVGELDDALNEGLAGFTFDLAFDGGALAPVSAPVVPLDHFAVPLGWNNPAGFEGTLVAGDLVQVGGMQNTINDLFVAGAMTGAVVTSLAQPGAPLTLASGSLTAPAALGTYTLDLSGADANVIRDGETGLPHWAVDAAPIGNATDLTVEVVALSADVETLSLGSPGTQTFSLHAGAAHGGKTYLLCGTFSGTSPGLPLPPFGVNWPLNFDDLTLLGFTNANTFPYSNSLATLDASGEASASFSLIAGLNPGFIGTTLHHSFITIFGGSGADLASNPVPALLVP